MHVCDLIFHDRPIFSWWFWPVWCSQKTVELSTRVSLSVFGQTNWGREMIKCFGSNDCQWCPRSDGWTLPLRLCLDSKNLGGVGGCGALMVVQAATTPPNMQAGKMMFKSGMFSGEELTITGASKEPGFWSHFRILSHQSCSVNNSWLQTNLDQSIISHQLVSMTKHTPINSRITNHM